MVGFDMDHTFVRYKLDNMYDLMHGALCHFLQDMYPKELFVGLNRDQTFEMKGQIFDTVKGHFIAVDSTGNVCSLRHGSGDRIRDTIKIHSEYPEGKWEHFNLARTFSKDIDKYVAFLSAFGIPAAFIIATVIDWIDENENSVENRKKAYRKLVHHVYDGFNHHYDPDSLVLDQGHFFPNIKRNPEKFLHKVPDTLLEFVKILQRQNKKVFLMTNSRADFTEVVCDYALGPGWRSLFDIVVCHAQKPSFFFEEKPFFQTDGILSGGNSTAFLERNEFVSREKSLILYFGDDVNGDVFAPSHFSNWHTVAILEELERPSILNLGFVEHFFNEDKKSFLFSVINQYSRYCVSSVEMIAKFVIAEANSLE